MSTEKLGQLEKVDLRTAWNSESSDFTPWLADEVNIAALGDVVGLDLEVEAQEKQVGPFRADILCKDTASDRWVLIENQLERTDHSHLGQLLTYAAGLNAVTIVWIAKRFTDEHRAALDWLNDITSDDFSFFGLEVELWRIGESPVAPKFNIVSKPNDWTRTISGATRQLQNSELSDTRKLQLEFWTGLRILMEDRGGRVKPTKPAPQSWQTFALGRSGFLLSVHVNTRERKIGVRVVLNGEDAKPHFHLLHAMKSAIEKEAGRSFDWRENPGKKESHISLVRENADPANQADWADHHEWLYDALQSFHRALNERVKRLDANEWPPQEDEG